MRCTRVKATLKLQKKKINVGNKNYALVEKCKWEYFSSQNKYLIKATHP